VTRPPLTGQATEPYRGEPSPGTPPERVPVALVAGSGPVAADDLYPVLRRRLLILCSIIVAGFLLTVLVDLVLDLLLPPHERLPSPSGPLGGLLAAWRGLVIFAVQLGLAIFLWLRPPAGVAGLRWIELVVVGMSVFGVLLRSVSGPGFDLMVAAADDPPHVREAYYGAYAGGGRVVWGFILMSYGALIPNTWRRCAVVTGVIAISPLVLFAVFAFGVRPLDPALATMVLLLLASTNAIAMAIAVFASARIETARRQAAEARKLGQYVLKEKLGSGGMGEVYRAQHVLLRRPCAIKVIRQERAGDAAALRRFEREVQVTATLTHPNTVHIYDYGHAADGTFYYVMEYLPGVTLDELVQREGPLPPGRVVHLLRQVCGALREAHSLGLIHRDVKPGNVIVCERGGVPDVAKLLDFGLVLPPVGDPDADKLTRDGTLTGTPAYLSPEQAGMQDAVDARSDVYSVGALAYFLLTGRPPFADRSAVKMLAAHLYETPETPEPPSTHRPGIPADLEAVVLRCLAKKPEERFADVTRLDAALAACSSVWGVNP